MASNSPITILPSRKELEESEVVTAIATKPPPLPSSWKPRLRQPKRITNDSSKPSLKLSSDWKSSKVFILRKKKPF
jgi:hypothetical protein